MPYTENGDTRLYYESFGAGEPLALIMGLGGTIQAWGLQIAELAKQFRLIVVDNRGAGRSDKPDQPYSIELFADDLACVLDAAQVPEAHLLGVSMGGLIAQEFYHRYPQRVRSLTLGCTGVGANDPAFHPADAEVIDALNLDREREDPRTVMDAMTTIFYHPDYRARVPDLSDKLLKINEAAPQPAHAYQRQLQAAISHRPFSPRLPTIKVPTLVLHGEHDRVWPLSNAEYLAAHIPGAQLKVIPASAHMFMIEKPREFNAAVIDFLQNIAASPTDSAGA